MTNAQTQIATKKPAKSVVLTTSETTEFVWIAKTTQMETRSKRQKAVTNNPKQKAVPMNTAVTTVTTKNNTSDFTPQQMTLIRDTIAKNATPDELKLFLYRATAMGLDPLKPGQIHFVKYGSGAGSVVVGIEGFRSIAHKTGQLAGIKHGAIKDEKGKLIGAWAEVFRKDWTSPAREEVPLEEYLGTSPIWKKMPETMIKKVAECAALRMAFPNDLGGVYEQAELDQADHGLVTPNAYGGPGPEDGMQGDEVGYRIPFGKFKGRAIEEIDFVQLRSYVEYLEAQAVKKGETIKGVVKEFIDHAEAVITAFENGAPE